MRNECRKTRDQMADLVAGILSERDAGMVQEHCIHCPACRDYLRALKQEDTLLTEYFSRVASDTEERERAVLDALRHAEIKSHGRGPWSRPMAHRLAKLAVAATVALAVIIGTWGLLAPPPAYGLPEAWKRWQNAQTVHIKGFLFLDPGDEKLERFPFEVWLDRRKGCFRYSHPLGWFGDYTSDPEYRLVVSDGQYLMDAYHRANQGRAEFTKLSPFQQRLQTRTLEPFPAFMANPEEVKGFRKIGREPARGRTAEVWEGEIIAVGKSIPGRKLRLWLSPAAGEILRLMEWRNVAEAEQSIRWLTTMDADTIEYDAPPAPDCFQTDPPAGCKLTNTRETAVMRELGDDGRSRFYTCLGFTLNDGTVILGWHANHQPGQSQARHFANLKLGGPLPPLPARIVGLKPWPVDEDITCTGHHLAWTQKNGKCYEWGLYVADKQMPQRRTFQDYKVVCDYNNVEPRAFGGRPNLVAEELAINSEAEFNTWVRGAMAELSDDATPPPEVTWQKVIDLARQLRKR
jgi:hypothetical protein